MIVLVKAARLTCIASILLISTLLHSAETASVLPENFYRARLVVVSTDEIADSFSSNGRLAPLSASLNRSISAKDWAQQIKQLAPLMKSIDGLSPELSNQLLNTQIVSDTSMKVDTTILALEYGLTKKMTLGIRAPITRTQIDSRFSATTINNATAISKAIGPKISGSVQKGLEGVSKLDFGTDFFKQNIFTAKGYKAPTNSDTTELGDVELGLKYQVLNKPKQRVSMQLGLRLPTGSVSPLDDLFYPGTGGGANALGALLIQDYDFNSNWTGGMMLKLVKNIDDTRNRAVPKDSSDVLPSLLPEDGQVQRVTRFQPLDLESELSLNYTFDSKKWSLWGAYQYLASGEDSFSGPGDLFYEGLSVGSSFEKTDLEFGFMYSSVPAFRNKEFPVPMKIETLYKTSLEGENTPLVSYVRMDMIVFF